MAKKRQTAAQKKAAEAKKQSKAHLKNPRQVFNKDSLMFHTQNDYTDHWQAVADKAPEKDVLFRSIKHLQKPSVKTHADFMAFRVDCLRSKEEAFNYETKEDYDNNANFKLQIGTKSPYAVDIDKSIERSKEVLNAIKDELRGLGLEAPDSLFELTERDRTEKAPRTNKRKLQKIDRLKDLFKSSGIELKQVGLFDSGGE